ncbi:hypothetical protein [Micropruina glycogenica]|uniref:hypothetical protein n=1 Tax=Micropruina glycogenica TaxID=75385 RepID=UPI00131A0838|nr:hypothetical protein [Micropruina glycogenica]
MQQPSDDRPAGGAAGRDRVRRVRHDDRAVQPAAGAGVLDVAAAQVAVCLITWAGVRLDRPGSRAPLGPQAWAATVTVIAVHLVGIVVAGPGSLVRCLGFAGPLPGLAGLADGGQRWRTGPAVVRIGLGLAAAGLLMALVLRAWRIPSLRPLGVAVATAWVAELLLGQLIAGQFTGDQARHFGLAALYSMLAGLIVWLLALLASAGSPTWSGGPPAETPHAAGDAGVPVPSRSGTRPGSSSP